MKEPEDRVGHVVGELGSLEAARALPRVPWRRGRRGGAGAVAGAAAGAGLMC